MIARRRGRRRAAPITATTVRPSESFTTAEDRCGGGAELQAIASNQAALAAGRWRGFAATDRHHRRP
ncbi:MAG: hypothetical protein V3T72_13980 [Thermoanaerobaculia bacterium]